MDPLIVLDCENAVPNRFALAVAAAGRARALSRGAEPRLTSDVTVPVELARSMIPSMILKKLSASKESQLRRALRELGRIDRSLFMTEWY
ncbi:DNA-directed RNA polymerase subunit omega [Mesorhizobium sp. B2-6-4]|uniref:DNA-directed RNA polymerase subunit omega n=1 Tax=Mesorhizobium sp. B2-6-4 TaxID=2589913 RepID=UPI00112C3CF0|nr:DNA-directed RNA polymerase subunit omega [Mesorhizobium sp. B2-6-4]TPJ49613.1 Tn3 family transposase [Mesorhizobium sp. B2-6-4]